MRGIGTKQIIITVALAGLLSAENGAKAQTFPSSPHPFYPPIPSGLPSYTPIPPQKAPPTQQVPSAGKPEKGVIDPRTGEFYPGVYGGVINPRTGVVLPKVESGYLNPETGEVIPNQK